MLSDKNSNSVLDALHEAILQPHAWINVCDRLAAVAGASGAVLIPDEIDKRKFGLPHSKVLKESSEVYQRDSWYRSDERDRRKTRNQESDVVIDQDIVTPDEMARSTYYQEFLRPCGFKWFAGIKFKVGRNDWSASIQRTLDQKPFDEADRERLALFSSHLSRAANLASAFNYVRAEGLIEAFEQMSSGAIALDENGRAIIVNNSARTLLGDGLEIAQDRIKAHNPDDEVRLAALIRECVAAIPSIESQAPQTVTIERPSGDRSYLVSACPVRSQEVSAFARARAILLIVDPSRGRRPKIDLLRLQFGLTLPEAKLAEQLAMGHSLNEAADTLSITDETARFYLKSILSKTETHRQGQLVALLSSLAMVV